MGVITKEVEITLSPQNIKWFEDKGYKIPRTQKIYKRNNGYYSKKYTVSCGTKIKVNVFDLRDNSHEYVDCSCDKCHKPLKMKWQTYNIYNHNGYIYCQSCACKIFNSGTNNYNWNMDLTQKDRELGRNYPEYVDFIKRVLNRDNYTCQCCGKNEVQMEVHYLDGYDWCKERRTDDTNGITLCPTCHKSFHLIYGYGGNTKQQFENWSDIKNILFEKYNGELPTARAAYCITDNIKIENIMQYAKENKLHISSIYKCCNGESNMYKSKIYVWYDIYEQMTKNDIKNYIKERQRNSKTKEVVCNNYKMAFYSVKHASMYFGIPGPNISTCCKGKIKSAGKANNGEKLFWEYAYNINNINEYKYITEENCEL